MQYNSFFFTNYQVVQTKQQIIMFIFIHILLEYVSALELAHIKRKQRA